MVVEGCGGGPGDRPTILYLDASPVGVIANRANRAAFFASSSFFLSSSFALRSASNNAFEVTVSKRAARARSFSISSGVIEDAAAVAPGEDVADAFVAFAAGTLLLLAVAAPLGVSGKPNRSARALFRSASEIELGTGRPKRSERAFNAAAASLLPLSDTLPVEVG